MTIAFVHSHQTDAKCLTCPSRWWGWSHLKLDMTWMWWTEHFAQGPEVVNHHLKSIPKSMFIGNAHSTTPVFCTHSWSKAIQLSGRWILQGSPRHRLTILSWKRIADEQLLPVDALEQESISSFYLFCRSHIFKWWLCLQSWARSSPSRAWDPQLQSMEPLFDGLPQQTPNYVNNALYSQVIGKWTFGCFLFSAAFLRLLFRFSRCFRPCNSTTIPN